MMRKRILQSLLVLCLAFLWMPEVSHAENDEVEVELTEDIIPGTDAEKKFTDSIKNSSGKNLKIVLKGNVTFGASSTQDSWKLGLLNKKITFDGGGHTLSLEKTGWQAAEDTSVVLNNITIELKETKTGDPIFLVDKGGKLVMDSNVTLKDGTTDKKLESAVKVENGGEFTMNGGTIDGGKVGVHNEGTFTMAGGTIQNSKNYGVYNNGNFTMNVGTIENCVTNTKTGCGVHNQECGTFTMNGGTIKNLNKGVESFANSQGTFTMNGGTIDGVDKGVFISSVSGTFTMAGGTIQNSKNYGVKNNGTFTMTAGTIRENTETDVANEGTFIKTVGTTNVGRVTGNGTYQEVDPVPSTDPATPEAAPATGSTFSESLPENPWKPTTPEDKRRFGCCGGEPVKYTVAKENPYELIAENALQGPKCFVSFDAVLGNYTIARTYDIYPASGRQYHMDQKARIQLEIPTELQENGRSFRMICVTEDGKPTVLKDLDKDSATITFETDQYYAFALIYK